MKIELNEDDTDADPACALSLSHLPDFTEARGSAICGSRGTARRRQQRSSETASITICAAVSLPSSEINWPSSKSAKSTRKASHSRAGNTPPACPLTYWY